MLHILFWMSIYSESFVVQHQSVWLSIAVAGGFNPVKKRLAELHHHPQVTCKNITVETT